MTPKQDSDAEKTKTAFEQTCYIRPPLRTPDEWFRAGRASMRAEVDAGRKLFEVLEFLRPWPQAVIEAALDEYKEQLNGK